MDDRPGCFSGLLRLLFLSWLFDWLQDNYGFGKGLSCTGCGCGMVLLVLFLFFACSVLTGTDWFQLGF